MKMRRISDSNLLLPLEIEEMPSKLGTTFLETVIDPVFWITDGKHPQDGFKLFDDVSQLYELQIAKLEFLSLGFDLELFRKRTAYFEIVDGRRSYHSYISKVKGKGQIGHTNQYMTHWFYPYKGKFHGQMIKAIINFTGAESGDIILDPFLGSGTTLLETTLSSVKGIGVEINPALCIVSQIKLDALKINYPEFSKEIKEKDLSQIFKYFKKADAQESNKRLTLEIGKEKSGQKLLEQIWTEFFPPSSIKELPFDWRNLLMLIYFHALSDYTYLKGTAKEKSIEEFFVEDFQEYSQTLKGVYETLSFLNLPLGGYEVVLGSALKLPLNSSSIKGVITSPPYSIALDYVANDLHLINYFGIPPSKLKSAMIGLKGTNSTKLDLYQEDMKKSLEEIYRVLKPKGWAVIVLGDVVVGNRRTNFCRKIIDWAPRIGFKTAFALKRAILGGFARLRFEYLLFLQK